MSTALRAIYGEHYRAMPTAQLWEEAQALFADHSVSAELSTRKFAIVIDELASRGIVMSSKDLRGEELSA
jgi:hypothetical protein